VINDIRRFKDWPGGSTSRRGLPPDDVIASVTSGHHGSEGPVIKAGISGRSGGFRSADLWAIHCAKARDRNPINNAINSRSGRYKN
jgi:hypothetical protein